MVYKLYLKFLKLFAIFGLAPYRPLQRQKHIQHRRHTRHARHPQNQFRMPPHRYNYERGAVHNREFVGQQIYTVMLITLNCLLTLYGLIYIPFEDATIIQDLVSVLVFVLQIIVIVVVLLETMLSYDKHYAYLNNLWRIQMLAKCLLQTQICVQTIRQRQQRRYAVFVVTIYGFLIAVIVVISQKYYYGYFWHALLAVLILRTRCLQMLMALDYICYYLEFLNQKLKALISCRIYNNYLCLDVNYRHLMSYEYLENFKRIYEEIYILHTTYNHIFGLSLVAILTVVVLDITIHVYWSLLTMMHYYKMYFIYITISTLVPLTSVVWMLCYAGEQCEKQVIFAN